MMKVTIKLFATLRKGRFAVEEREYGGGTTVRGVIKDLGISEQDAALLFVDGRHADLDRVLSDGEALAVFPPVGGG